MFSAKIGSSLVCFTKFFGVKDVEAVQAVVADLNPAEILFVDTPSTCHLSDLIRDLKEKDIVVYLRDHHDVLVPSNPREEQITAAVLVNCDLLGEDAVISDRASHPGCSTLVEVGEFVRCELVVADPDADGLLAAMKALGVTYDGLDSDGAVLDGPRSAQTVENLTELGWLFARSMSTLPPYNPKRPETSLKAKGELFQSFVNAVEGDEDAMSSLQSKVSVYETGVKEAQRLLAETVSQPCNAVVLTDTVGAQRSDLATLTRGLEAYDGCKVTVIRKNFGPIAANQEDGIQYSLAVVKKYQADINLQDLLPEGFVSSPVSGIISNISFLLHVSETVWNDTILPNLKKSLS